MKHLAADHSSLNRFLVDIKVVRFSENFSTSTQLRNMVCASSQCLAKHVIMHQHSRWVVPIPMVGSMEQENWRHRHVSLFCMEQKKNIISLKALRRQNDS